MTIDISASFGFHLDQPTDVLLQFEAAAIPEQTIVSSDTWIPTSDHTARVPAQDNIGERFWIRAQGDCRIDYSARVELQRIVPDIATLDQVDPHRLPGEAVGYLFGSRYCEAEKLQSFVSEEFGDLQGGAKIVAMRDWISQHFTYQPGVSNPSTTALDSFVERRGICRDYAHVMIGLARAAAIPARYVSCYAPGVEPPDFHALAEVFLADPEIAGGGAWHIVDATGMADPASTAKIGVGRDAADVSFMTVFGMARFDFSDVRVAAAP